MKLQRNVVRLNREHLLRLDEISEFATGVLAREVSRAAVIRAALDEWLASRAELSPGDVLESILSGIVKRGRASFEEIQRERGTESEPVRKRPVGRRRRSVLVKADGQSRILPVAPEEPRRIEVE